MATNVGGKVSNKWKYSYPPGKLFYSDTDAAAGAAAGAATEAAAGAAGCAAAAAGAAASAVCISSCTYRGALRAPYNYIIDTYSRSSSRSSNSRACYLQSLLH